MSEIYPIGPYLKRETGIEMEWFVDQARKSYAEAKAYGMVDPIIYFENIIDDDTAAKKDMRAKAERDGTTPFHFGPREREHAIDALDGFPDAIEMMRTPTPGCDVTILLVIDEVLTVYECIATAA